MIECGRELYRSRYTAPSQDTVRLVMLKMSVNIFNSGMILRLIQRDNFLSFMTAVEGWGSWHS